MRFLAFLMVVVVALAGTVFAATVYQKATIEAEVIHITPTTILPKTITRPSGSFALLVRNCTSLKGMVLTLQAQGNSAAALQTDIDATGGSVFTVLNLPAGVYTLSVSGHSQLKSVITLR